ncbi:hypothetical protein ABC977_03555 [Thioalkalicoccus limnaeus]|uniref:Tyrosine kinase G-rich domain-containing protein n=1 Tax=Thioalkalicoccus limnaeus TaxID=120681 RepID=A0ABV4BAL1_9GAMM
MRSLEAELAGHRAQVAEFTNRFAEHRALEQELARLEELYTTQQERFARIEMTNREQFPPLEVIDYAPLPLAPMRPAYTRDAGIVLEAALVLALFFA